MSVDFVPIPSDRFLDVLKLYEKQFESSTPISRFFHLLAIRFGKLSTKQQETFQLFSGCLDEGFFKTGNFLGLFKTVLKPLYEQEHHSLKLYFGNHQQEDIDTAMEVLELGQFFVELFFPRNISDFEYINRLNDAGISDKTIVDLLLVRRKTFLSCQDCQEMIDIEVYFKEFFRDGYETGYFYEVLLELISLNSKIIEFLWNHCDRCGKMIQNKTLDDKIRACTDCGGLCVLLTEPIPAPRQTLPAHSQASDPLQALATELIDAKISFRERAHQIASVLLENGVFELSNLSVLKPSEFDSLVETLHLNTIQVQKLRVASEIQ